MAEEKAIVISHSLQLEMALGLASELASVVSDELNGSVSSGSSTSAYTIARKPVGVKGQPQQCHRRKDLHPLLVFRKLAIAVIAFRRFCRILQFSSSLCVVRDCPFGFNCRLPVWVCAGEIGGSKATGRLNGTKQSWSQELKQQKLSHWIGFLRSEEFLAKVTESSQNMSSLLLDTSGMQRGRKLSATLQLCARDQLGALVRGLDDHFISSSLWDVTDSQQLHLVTALQRGLQHCIECAKRQESSQKYGFYHQVSWLSFNLTYTSFSGGSYVMRLFALLSHVHDLLSIPTFVIASKAHCRLLCPVISLFCCSQLYPFLCYISM